MSSISYLRRSPSTGSEPEMESTTDFSSTSESSDNPSETSSDREFVVSDTETLSRRSFSDYSTENGISDSADDISIGSPHIHRFRPIKVLVKRSVNRTDRPRPNIWSYGVPGRTRTGLPVLSEACLRCNPASRFFECIVCSIVLSNATSTPFPMDETTSTYTSGLLEKKRS
ncbi:hypothetical protein ASPCAL15027 [Aspergillus calidoustus]|uniref:Uncharacterized protein n=1 Tax=Aspergillus calidoustus TaxID=454130 RepID=A0A0U5GKP8_ASPCI|nr:hypothetical protein ASPCAL15027 [Aspergillus calidoustus]